MEDTNKKNKYFINEHEFNSDVIKEYLNGWYKYYYTRPHRLLMLIVMLIALFIAFDVPNVSTGIVISIIFLFFDSISVLVTKKIHIKTEIEKNNMLNNGKVAIKTIFTENIQLIKSNGENHIEFKNIKALIETKNLFLILLKGKLIVIIRKDGFIEGNCEEFKLYIKELIKANK